MNEILISDSTLRDGSHAIGHQFTSENIRDYARGAELAGEELVVVGHGNGLGASSLQLGISLLSDRQMLSIARKQLKQAKLGAFLIPGFGTIENDLAPAITTGIDTVMIACHCTEANITRQHIEYSRKMGLAVYGILMMSHMIGAEELVRQAKLMQDYGAHGVLLMDSAGAYLPDNVSEKISRLVKELNVKVGFHAHNNLGMAIANSVAAVRAGAKIIDCTSRGLGAGAGNCQLEVLVAVLEKMGIKTGLNLHQLMENSEKIIAKIARKPQIITEIELTSGLAGVFSGFAPHAKKAAKRFKVDAREILIEAGRRGAVAGQEDIIIDIAVQLASGKGKKSKIHAKY